MKAVLATAVVGLTLFGLSTGLQAASIQDLLGELARSAPVLAVTSIAERPIVTPVQQAVSVSDAGRITDLIERPIAPDGLPSSVRLSTLIDMIFTHRRIPELRDTRTVLEAPEPFAQILSAAVKCPLGSTSHRRSRPQCTVANVYARYRDRWLASVKESAVQGRNPGVKTAEELVARREWDSRGYRKVVTLAVAHIQLSDALSPEVSWDRLERDYLQGGGASTRNFGRISEISTYPAISQLSDPEFSWNSVLYGGVVRVEFTLLKIERPWLSPELLWQLRWGWDRAAPLGQGLLLSDGQTCAAGQFPCLSEWLIVVKGTSLQAALNQYDPGDYYVVGLVGESLPVVPAAPGTQPIRINGAEQIGQEQSLSDIRRRLSDGTF